MPDTQELFDCKIAYNGDYRFDERDIDAIIQGVDVTARMGKMSVFVLDLEEKRIRYSSPDMLFAKEIGKDRQANEHTNMYWCAMSQQTTRIMKCAAIKKDGSTWTYDFAGNRFKVKEDDFSQLSQAEKAILKMAEMGCSKEDISRLKNISLNTVKSHYRNIFRKLGVSNISSAITCIRNSYG